MSAPGGRWSEARDSAGRIGEIRLFGDEVPAADTAPSAAPPREHHPVRYLRAFWHRAYRENITGLAGMVAYNLLFALFPFTLLILFVVGQVIKSSEAEMSILLDLQRIFPAAEEATLSRILDQIRDSSTTIGVAAIVGALWVGTSFWGAMDTAFCRICSRVVPYSSPMTVLKRIRSRSASDSSR